MSSEKVSGILPTDLCISPSPTTSSATIFCGRFIVLHTFLIVIIMDNPPPYDDNARGIRPNEKPTKVTKSNRACTYEDSQAENSVQRGRLLLEGSHRPNDRIGMELVPAGNRVIELDDDFDASMEGPVQLSRPGAYFRPQATLDQPLDIDLDAHRRRATYIQPRDTSGVSNQELSPAEELTFASLEPSWSEDKKIDYMLDRHKDISFDMLYARFSDMKPQNSGNRNLQVITQPDDRSANTEMAIRPLQQTGSSHAATMDRSVQHSSLPLQHQRQKTAAEQEEEDFQLALQLSQQDVPARSFSTPQIGRSSATLPTLDAAISTRRQPGSTSIRIRGVTNQELPPPARAVTTQSSQRDSPLRDLVNNTSASALSIRGSEPSPHIYAQDATPIEPLPLFPGGVSTTHLSRFSSALGPLANNNAEQQALSDSVAMHNLHAQRQADRTLAERNFMHNLRSQPQNDRALQATVALARESLADSRVQTSLTNMDLLSRSIQETRTRAAKDELAQLQRREELELEKRQRIMEDSLRNQEAVERRHAHDQQRQRESDERRRQEDEDARFAMELNRMQHEQTLEKVDAFSRAVRQPERRRPIPQLRSQTLNFSGHDTPAGSVREIAYSSGDDDHNRDIDEALDYIDYHQEMKRRGRY